MKLTAYPKTIFCLALLLAWGSCVPPAMAQSRHGSWILIESWSAPQTVEVHTPQGSYNAVFASAVQVFPDGTASGFLTLTPTDRHPGGANFAFSDGSVRFIRADIAAVMVRGHSEEGNRVVVMITPGASEDCLIYTTVGSDVHASWEAQGSIVVNR
jgi:prepilin-type processing-associated H-X9-DG protein